MGSVWPCLYGYFSLKMVLMLMHVYSWYSGFHSNWCRAIRPYLEWMGKPVSLALWNVPRWFLSSFNVRPDSSWGATTTSGFLSQRSRGIDPQIELRRGITGLFLSCGVKLGIPLEWGWVSWRPFWVASRESSTLSCFKRERGVSLETLLWKRASSHIEGRISWFFWSCSGKLGVPLKLWQGYQGLARVASE